MADNKHRYGFRFYSTQRGGGGRPACFEGIVASGYQANVNITTPTDVGVSIGDPVSRASDGTYRLANDLPGNNRFAGVVMAITNAQVNGRGCPVSYLRGGTIYTKDTDASRILIAPFSSHIWELDTNEAVFDLQTLADYRDIMGLNVTMDYFLDLSDPDKPRANPMLNINTPNVIATNAFRLHDVSKTKENFDFTGAFVKLLVQLNVGADPMIGLDGVAGL